MLRGGGGGLITSVAVVDGSPRGIGNEGGGGRVGDGGRWGLGGR